MLNCSEDFSTRVWHLKVLPEDGVPHFSFAGKTMVIIGENMLTISSAAKIDFRSYALWKNYDVSFFDEVNLFGS